MTHAEAKSAFESFKAAKAESTLTNQEIVTRYNKLYEKQRVLAVAAETEQKVNEQAAEILRLKSLLESKQTGKATGRAA